MITISSTVTVNSCTNHKVTFTLSEAANGGIIYIQGAGPGCRHATYTGSNVFEFTSSSCGIVWVSRLSFCVYFLMSATYFPLLMLHG